mmetsp:Transcript_22167/g.44445  ORF Transcript_22167/g.44445 Transcript_22167/m.44445 type:complete len:131 (+) Transcript_22167:1-393(+)
MHGKEVTNNTALFGEFSAHHGDYDDVYIHVIPPLTIIERNLEKRQRDEKRKKSRWAKLGPVTERRRTSLLHIIKDEVLVEPLFATFQEGLEFCINVYKNDVRLVYPEEPPKTRKTAVETGPFAAEKHVQH